MTIKSVTWKATTIPAGSTSPGVERKIFKLGWFAFIYCFLENDAEFDYCGPLRWVNWERGIWFPEDPSCRGIKFVLRPGVVGNFVINYAKQDALDIMVKNNPVNLTVGKVAGLRAVSPSGLTGPTPLLLKGYVSSSGG